MSACEGSQSFLSVSRTDGKQLILRVCCHRDNPTFHHRPTVLGAVKDEALTGAQVRVLDRSCARKEGAWRRGKRPTDLRKKNIGTRGPALDTTTTIKERSVGRRSVYFSRMPTQCSQEEMDFGSCGGRKLVGAFDGGAITSNGGALLLGAADRSIRVTHASAILRLAEGITHTMADLLRQRIFALALGYEDLFDHDQLRHDPALAAVPDKPGGRLAGKSTLNRAGARRQDRPGPALQVRSRRRSDRAAVCLS
jgi:hypothetical protein